MEKVQKVEIVNITVESHIQACQDQRVCSANSNSRSLLHDNNNT